jgi:hypothetical protein
VRQIYALAAALCEKAGRRGRGGADKLARRIEVARDLR